MLLHRIHLDPRCREARRDLADPYQMHATLCRAFSPPEARCPPGEVLWRLEPETGSGGLPRVLIQGRTQANWDRIGIRGWLAGAEAPIDLDDRLRLVEVRPGRRFRFRLRANPCVTRNKKRLGLMQQVDQEDWIRRKGLRHGFSLPLLAASDPSEALQPRVDVRISQEEMLRGNQHMNNGIRVFSVLYDGVLAVVDPVQFHAAIRSGIGHGKALGLGLLSAAPIP